MTEPAENERSKVETFYNGACPVCDAGIREQKRALDRAGAADAAGFTDMALAPDALAADGVTLDQVRRHIYVRDVDGTLQRGADAVAALWRATPGRRLLGRFLGLPVVRPVARLLYDWFADRLYSWNRRKGRW